MPISNRTTSPAVRSPAPAATPRPSADLDQLKDRYSKISEREAKKTEKAIEQAKARYHATYERAVDKGQLKALDPKRSAELDSLWQRGAGLTENITEGNGPTRVLMSYDNVFVRTQPKKAGSRASWESAGQLLDATASKGWVAR